jgi:hypothetical protein
MKIFKVKNEAGDIFEVDEDKLSAAEADGYLPIARRGEEEYRVAAKDIAKAEADGFDMDYSNATPILSAKGLKEAGAGLLSGAQRGVSLGFADELAGLSGALGGMAGGDVRSFGEIYDEAKKEYKKEQQDIEKLAPTAATVGNVAGTIFPALLTGGGSIVGQAIRPALLQSAKVGAAFGGLQGLGESEAEMVSDIALDTLKGVAVGGTLGAAIPAAGAGLSKAVPVASKAAQTVKDTTGKVLEAIAEAPGIKPALQGYRIGRDITKELGVKATSTKGKQAAVTKLNELATDIGTSLQAGTDDLATTATNDLTAAAKDLLKIAKEGKKVFGDKLETVSKQIMESDEPVVITGLVKELREDLATKLKLSPELAPTAQVINNMLDTIEVAAPAKQITKTIKVAPKKGVMTENVKLSSKDMTPAELMEVAKQGEAGEILESSIAASKGKPGVTATTKSEILTPEQLNTQASKAQLFEMRNAIREKIKLTSDPKVAKFFVDILDKVENSITSTSQKAAFKEGTKGYAQSASKQDLVFDYTAPDQIRAEVLNKLSQLGSANIDNATRKSILDLTKDLVDIASPEAVEQFTRQTIQAADKSRLAKSIVSSFLEEPGALSSKTYPKVQKVFSDLNIDPDLGLLATPKTAEFAQATKSLYPTQADEIIAKAVKGSQYQKLLSTLAPESIGVTGATNQLNVISRLAQAALSGVESIPMRIGANVQLAKPTFTGAVNRYNKITATADGAAAAAQQAVDAGFKRLGEVLQTTPGNRAAASFVIQQDPTLRSQFNSLFGSDDSE